MKPAEISRALGYAEIDIKRLAALSALPPVALEALRAGRTPLYWSFARTTVAAAQAPVESGPMEKEWSDAALP